MIDEKAFEDWQLVCIKEIPFKFASYFDFITFTVCLYDILKS